MKNLEIIGTILEIKTKTGTSAKGEWKSESVVIEHESGQYPKNIVVENFNDKVTGLKVGREVKLSCNIDAKEYNGNWYNKISAFKGEILVDALPTATATQAPPPAANQTKSDDLPF